jgi:hypothetical protein
VILFPFRGPAFYWKLPRVGLALFRALIGLSKVRQAGQWIWEMCPDVRCGQLRKRATMGNSEETVSVSADGEIVKVGNKYYLGAQRVKVLEVMPYDGINYRQVKVTNAGIVYASDLYKDVNGKYIGV